METLICCPMVLFGRRVEYYLSENDFELPLVLHSDEIAFRNLSLDELTDFDQRIICLAFMILRRVGKGKIKKALVRKD